MVCLRTGLTKWKKVPKARCLKIKSEDSTLKIIIFTKLKSQGGPLSKVHSEFKGRRHSIKSWASSNEVGKKMKIYGRRLGEEKGVKAPVKATGYQDEAGEVHPGHKQLRDCIACRYSKNIN